MKTERRHDLETNTLAKLLTTWSDRLRPYSNAVAIGAASLVALFFIISWVSGSSSSRGAAAWDEYNAAVEGFSPDMQQLKLSAESHAGTPMQQWADITWADGQLLSAARGYLINREAADKSLELASSAYETLLRRSETDNPRIIDRAHFGLARVYELRQDFDKAREHYLAVKGSFAELAQRRAEELDSARTKDAVAWLAKAEVPRQPAPTGPGTPGQRPDFSADPVEMPAEQPGDVDAALKDIFERFNRSADALDPEAADDRYVVPEGDPEQPADDAAADGGKSEEAAVDLELDTSSLPAEESSSDE